MATYPIDPTKLGALLDVLEQEQEGRQVPAFVPIGTIRRAMSHGRLDLDVTK